MDNNQLKREFLLQYGGKEEDIRVFSAPGRVNLIGEHTDYNGGFVFPAALTVSSTAVVRPRKDREINLMALDLKIPVKAYIDNLDDYKGIKWGSYQLGVADELLKAGYDITGCDILYYDTVPLKSGLSSSAAIEVVTALSLVSLAQAAGRVEKETDLKELALIAQKAENNYVGVNCGIMDQFASALGQKDKAIFLDCSTLEYELVPLNLDGCKLIISNTNKKRSLAVSKYNERRAQCEKGLKMLKTGMPDLNYLGSLSTENFEDFKHLIEDDIVSNRVRHIVYEDDRVKKSVEALKNKQLDLFGRYMVQSHESLRDLYEVTGEELDIMFEEVLKIDGVIGTRMTGAGFGGCTVSIVKEEAITDLINKVGENYRKRTGIDAAFYISEAGDGAREIIN